ncbi:MAG: hypothetical protein J7K15_12935 [Deltaproteobacteria bacterium]|nr:hypothetical protein [Deltaproteobacteria bacterium]
MEVSLIAWALTVVLFLLNIYFGRKYSKVKRFLKELAEAINETYKAIEDDKVTEEELKNVIKQWRDLLQAWRELL